MVAFTFGQRSVALPGLLFEKYEGKSNVRRKKIKLKRRGKSCESKRYIKPNKFSI